MRFSILAATALLGAVSALPGPRPVITPAPQPRDLSVDVSDNSSDSCTSTDCWASYAECHGSLTFVYLCFTPPPCGTVTSPDPYSCPPLAIATEAPTSTSTSPETFITSTTTA